MNVPATMPTAGHAGNPVATIPTPLMEAFFALALLEKLAGLVPPLEDVPARRLGIDIAVEILERHGTPVQRRKGARAARSARACCNASVIAYGTAAPVFDIAAFRAKRAGGAS